MCKQKHGATERKNARYLKSVRLLEKAMMSWITCVARSVTCGRAVKTQPCLVFSPPWGCGVSGQPRRHSDGNDEVKRDLTSEDVVPGWLLSRTAKMFLSIG